MSDLPNPRPMNLYEKVIIPVALATIIGGGTLGWKSINLANKTAIQLENNSLTQRGLIEEMKVLRERVSDHETRITVVEVKTEDD